MAVTDLATSRLVVYVEDFISAAPSRTAFVASGASPSASKVKILDPPAPSVQALAPAVGQQQLDCLAVSAGDASMCAAAWASHFVVFATPWEESQIRTVAVYRCEEVGALTLRLGTAPFSSTNKLLIDIIALPHPCLLRPAAPVWQCKWLPCGLLRRAASP